MNIEEAIKYIKNDIEIDKDTASWFEKGNKTKEQIEESINAYETLLTAFEKEKEKNKKAKEFIQENSHEFNCKRDDLIELEFDDNTNATDLIDILEGNW